LVDALRSKLLKHFGAINHSAERRASASFSLDE
jgi:hypothetical protein